MGALVGALVGDFVGALVGALVGLEFGEVPVLDTTSSRLLEVTSISVDAVSGRPEMTIFPAENSPTMESNLMSGIRTVPAMDEE